MRTATRVSTMRMTMAAPLPNTMAFFCWLAGRPRAAIAMTTALSPDSSTLARMMEPSAAQKAGVRRMSTRSEAGWAGKEKGSPWAPDRAGLQSTRASKLPFSFEGVAC